MKSIFSKVKEDDENLIYLTNKYIEGNYIDSMRQVDEKIKVAVATLDESCIEDLYCLFNNVWDIYAIDERQIKLNNFGMYILEKLLNFYVEKAHDLIHKYHYSLFLIFDLISHHGEILNNDFIIKQFVDASYPMLFTKDKIPQSELDLAIYKFISMLAFNEDIKDGRLLLRQFIAQEPLCPYTSDAKEALKRVRN